MSYDVIVLGAGMVGVSTALHLQARGLNPVLVDRGPAGEETSHGNAGVIEKDGHIPLTIPSKLIPLMKYGMNRQVAMRYHLRVMPSLAPWLMRMWQLSNPSGIDSYARRVAPLRQRSADAHFALADEAGVRDAFRETGWIHLFHNEKSFASTKAARLYAEEFGVEFDVLDMEGMEALEPSLSLDARSKGIFWKGCVSVSSPKRVTKAYADLYMQKGGAFRLGDAMSLKREGEAWVVSTQDGPVSARKVVVALGPWSLDLLKPMGYRFPLAVRRGYHQHFASRDGASLNRPIVDEDIGFLLTPMEDGIRLTSGIEFAGRDSRKTPVQIYRAAEWARNLYPLGSPVEDEPWMGSRPCFPDSLPLLEKSRKDEGLYFNFGHGHMGFATGPITGQLMAEMVTGAPLTCDIGGFSSMRF